MHDSVFSPLTPSLPCLLHPTALGLGVEVAKRDITRELEHGQAGRQLRGRQQGRRLLLYAKDGGYTLILAPHTRAPGESMLSSVPRVLCKVLSSWSPRQ